MTIPILESSRHKSWTPQNDEFMSFSVKNLPKEERPRERLLKYGADRLSIVELLTILISSGTSKESSFDISQKIIEKFKTAKILLESDPNELLTIKGLNIAKVCQIKSALEIAKRSLSNTAPLSKTAIVKSPEAIYKLVYPQIKNKNKENLLVLNLNSKSMVLSLVSLGSLTFAPAHPREIFSEAIKSNAYSIILIHNHPSNDCSPSEEDIALTKQVKESGQILNIPLVDHIIVCSSGFYSFKRENNLG